MLKRQLLFVVLVVAVLTAVVMRGLPAVAQPSANTADTADIVFQDENGNPLANATLRLLCFGADGTVLRHDLLRRTAVDGRLLDPLPSPCDRLAAMQIIHEQTSGKPGRKLAYTTYAVSWAPGTAVADPIGKVITIPSRQKLTLFHVVASLAWEPTTKSNVTDTGDVMAGLRSLSGYLYDALEGQAAIGPVQIHTGGEEWLGADLRFSTANDRRPSAFVGGMVPQTTVYVPPIKTGRRLIFTPAGTYYGRLWDGSNALGPGGQWDEPNAYRTIGHEWAHYAFFLYDEYLSPGGGQTRCVCQTLSSTGCGPGRKMPR